MWKALKAKYARRKCLSCRTYQRIHDAQSHFCLMSNKCRQSTILCISNDILLVMHTHKHVIKIYFYLFEKIISMMTFWSETTLKHTHFSSVNMWLWEDVSLFSQDNESVWNSSALNTLDLSDKLFGKQRY